MREKKKGFSPPPLSKKEKIICLNYLETNRGQIIWRCKICGYEYIADPIPDDFICPVCKHPASDFERIDP